MDSSLTTYLGYVLAAIGVFILFGFTVLIHEFGHFLAARLLGLQADTFAIGFGPAIWKSKKGATEYRINWIPFGGYVALPQLDPSSMAAIQGGDGNTLPPAAWWKRILVAAAGPFGNIVLGALLAILISVLPWSFEQPGFEHLGPTTIGWVEPGTPVEQAGLRAGDTILTVGNNPVATLGEVFQECHLLSGNEKHETTFTVSNRIDHTSRTLTIPLTEDKNGFFLPAGIHMSEICEIAHFSEDSPLLKTDAKVGDRILRVDGEYLFGFIDLTNRLAKANGAPMRMEFLRNQVPYELTITPIWKTVETLVGDEIQKEDRWIFGFQPQLISLNPAQWLKFHNPIRQLKDDAQSISRVLGGLIAPKHPGEAKQVAKSLGGPVIILVSIWKCLLVSLTATLGFIRFLNINLAIFNLIPFPVLDGGHILFALYEGIFRRKINKRVLNWSMNLFVGLILLLFAVLLYRDVANIFHFKLFH